jgi:divalent metal cation (Fe/Co/Zn/Cd) transporter
MELDIWTIVSAVLGLLSVVAGGLFLKAKNKLGAIKNLVKETFDLVKVAIEALDDDKLEKAEVEKIKQEALEVRTAWRVLIGKG